MIPRPTSRQTALPASTHLPQRVPRPAGPAEHRGSGRSSSGSRAAIEGLPSKLASGGRREPDRTACTRSRPVHSRRHPKDGTRSRRGSRFRQAGVPPRPPSTRVSTGTSYLATRVSRLVSPQASWRASCSSACRSSSRAGRGGRGGPPRRPGRTAPSHRSRPSGLCASRPAPRGA